MVKEAMNEMMNWCVREDMKVMGTDGESRKLILGSFYEQNVYTMGHENCTVFL